jgi:hypothetical protein
MQMNADCVLLYFLYGIWEIPVHLGTLGENTIPKWSGKIRVTKNLAEFWQKLQIAKYYIK